MNKAQCFNFPFCELKAVLPRGMDLVLVLSVSSFFTSGTLSCFFMLNRALKTLKKIYSPQCFYGLGTGTGVSRWGGHCDTRPRDPSQKGLLTQLLAERGVRR